MECTKEIKETLIKISNFIEANKDINYKIRLLEREVPDLQNLVKKLTTPVVCSHEKTTKHMMTGIKYCSNPKCKKLIDIE